MEELKMQAPIKMSMSVVVQCKDGRFAEVGFDFPPMRIPTKEEVWESIDEVVNSECLSDHEPIAVNKKAMFNYIVRERTGSDFEVAMPSRSNEWD